MAPVISPELKYKLEHWPVEKVLSWAHLTFGSRAIATSSFQTQSVPLLHLISRFSPELRVLFVDTGYHFPETLAFRDSLVKSLNLNLQIVQSEVTAPEFERQYGKIYQIDPDTCCARRKVVPLEKALGNFQVWISGIRNDQTEVRTKAEIIEFHGDMTKINPLIPWTQADINQYIEENNLPRHPLHANGYKSIGCYPCTQAVNEVDNYRYGRWIGYPKTECGIHCVSEPISGTTIKIS